MDDSDNKPHILVVDDDTRLRALLEQYLRDQGFAVTSAIHASDARRKLALFMFDLMVLDVMMPGETGLEFIRASHPARLPPTLLLTAMAEAENRIDGLEAGADDYLVKPFEPRELVLRINAILRRTVVVPSSRHMIAFGDFQFDLAQNRLHKNGDVVALTTGEAQLLKVLAENAGQAVTRDALALALGVSANERSIDVQVTRLRKKIEGDGAKPLYLQTVRGSGYVLYGDEAA